MGRQTGREGVCVLAYTPVYGRRPGKGIPFQKHGVQAMAIDNRSPAAEADDEIAH